MNTPNYGYGWQRAGALGDRALVDEGLRQHMLRVYNYMSLGLVVTGLVACWSERRRRSMCRSSPPR